MTTGSWNRDAWTYYSGGVNPWIGRKWDRNWTGTDYGAKPTYNPSTDADLPRVGLGAVHAREIFSALQQEVVDLANAEVILARDRKRKAYEDRKAQAELRRQRALEESFIRNQARLKRMLDNKERHRVEKEWRKIHHIPFKKEYLDRSYPGNIPVFSSTFRKPAQIKAKPPKRALLEDHSYSMSENLSFDAVVKIPHSFWPVGTSQFDPVVCMNSFGVSSWAPASLLDANDQIKMVNKLREKLQGSDFNMSVFLGEGHQTLRLIGDAAIKISKSLYHVKKGDFWGASRCLLEGTSRSPLKPYHPSWGRAAKDVGEVSARLLELQYGWKPLLTDVRDAATFLAHQLNAPYTANYRVGVRKEQRFSRTSLWSCYYGPTLGYRNESATSKSTKTHARHLIARIKESDLPTLPYALGLADPEVVLWELVPFSFVWDWFQPIGPYLTARAEAAKLRGTFVTSDKMTGERYPPESKWFAPRPDQVSDTRVSFTRTISTSLKVPMPTFKSLSKAASFQHCLNGLALLASAGTQTLRIR